MKTKFLLIECGATKADWVYHNTEEIKTFKTVGYNPYSNKDTTNFEQSVQASLPIDSIEPSTIHFYGAGCNTNHTSSQVKTFLSAIWPEATIDIQHDLLAAARGTANDEPAIICILGTGSNSCYYDGLQIISNTASLGYLLGDEGSGTALGKSLLKAYLRDQLSESTAKRLEAFTQQPKDALLLEIYKNNRPQQYLARFSQFILENLLEEEIRHIAIGTFLNFFSEILMKYPEAKEVPVHFTGSVSFHYKSLLAEIAQYHEIMIGSFTQSPIEGLIQYHLNKTDA